jgi:putative colanic acid biosynthesis acetyltransferase WcaF
MNAPLDASEFRSLEGGPSFPLRHRILRAVWNMTWLTLASWTPPAFRPWRRLLLRLFGAKLDADTDVRGSARVWYPPNLVMRHRAILAARVNCYNMALIEVGEWAIVSQGAHLCGGTHNPDDPNFQLLAKPIRIGRGAWIAAEAFVGPGVTVGDRAVLGARAVAAKDLAADTIYVGNPAAPKRRRSPPANQE